jgi:hypothetical protein
VSATSKADPSPAAHTASTPLGLVIRRVWASQLPLRTMAARCSMKRLIGKSSVWASGSSRHCWSPKSSSHYWSPGPCHCWSLTACEVCWFPAMHYDSTRATKVVSDKGHVDGQRRHDLNGALVEFYFIIWFFISLLFY